MIQHLLPLVPFMLIALIGFIWKRVQLGQYYERLGYCEEYHSKFVGLVNRFVATYTVDDTLYCELTEKAPRMQRELGFDGVIHMTDHLRGMQINDFQLLVNFLPELKRMRFWQDNSIMRERFMSLAEACDDAFMRHIGQLKDTCAAQEKSLLNPISCFAAGVKWLVWLPANLLLWSNIISDSTGYRLCNNPLTTIITHLVTLIGLLSSIITIIIGWDEFVSTTIKILEKYIG